ncbi:hypothetical protein [Peribacillus acanthi]|uniref:hypothetical protein n=1 Tax=Peribacillus acanthi TaxID=2171554 RepID=UPI001300211C|nr:hypothetical protein [Peribacillus acanthi]
MILFSGIGLGYIFEYFVLDIWRMYCYYPKVFKNKVVDSFFGGMLSQAVFIPIMATFLVAFKLGWKWRIGAGLFYGLIERIFLRWGLFKNRTWNTLFTITALPIYFWLIEKWWDAMEGKRKDLLSKFTLFFIYWVNYCNIYFFLVASFKKLILRAGFAKDKYSDTFIVAPLYTFYLSIIGTLTSLCQHKSSKILGFLTIHLSDQLLYKSRIIQPKNWSVFAFLPIHFVQLAIGEYSYKHIRKYWKI